MANPFFRNHWNPIRHGYFPQSKIQPQSTKPKVISIPVHFVGSENNSGKHSTAPAAAAASAMPTEEARIAAAVAIQRAVRGFLVRKNARIVRQVATEVEEIERKVREEEAMIRLNARERLLVSETLMALLLRLDSVRGVRDFRKRVIRRVISLQEAIDSITAADRPISTIDMAENQEGSRNEASEDSTMDHENITDQTLHLGEEMNEDEKELGMEITATVESPKRNGHPIATVDGTTSTTGVAEDPEVSRIEVTEEASLDHDNTANKTLDLVEETNEVKTELQMEIPAEVESPERQNDLILASNGTISSSRSLAGASNGTISIEVDEKSSINHEKRADQSLNLEEETNVGEAELVVEIPAKVQSPKRKSNLIGIEMGEDESRSPESEQIPKAEKEGASMAVATVDEGRGMREMLDRMAAENERLKGMVAQLCSASSEQCRLMNGLVDRVEQLERVVHHRMDRRKKRRSIAACSAPSTAK